MEVKLVAITQPRVEGVKTAEEFIVYAARVSNPSNQLNVETAPKLLKFCLDHGHVSIFEQASATLEIQTSRGIAPQILRHRSFTFQEFSQRYAVASEREVYEARKQDVKNRQNSTDDLSVPVKDWFKYAQDTVWANAMDLYNQALNNGIAKECARFLLPATTQTTLYMTGNIRSWIHYIEQRTKPGVQLEHKIIAEQARDLLKIEFPSIAEALGW